MDKPEYTEEIMAMARKALDDAEAECIKERYVYGFGTGNAKTVLDMHIAAAILSAQSQAYKDAARIAEKCGETELSWANMELPVSPGPVIAKDRARVASRISAAILQRKEEMK